MATPFIKALHQHFANSKISLLTHRHMAGLLAGSPWSEDVHYWPPKQHSGDSKDDKAKRREFIKTLRGLQFDLAVMLPNSLRSGWLSFRIGAKRRVGFNRDGRGLLLTDRVAVPNKTRDGYQPIPLVKYYAHLAQALGMEDPGDELTLFITDAEQQATDARLLKEGIDPAHPLITLCPGANFGASKCWAPERFAAVADQLVNTHQAQIVISPGPGEEPLAQAIVDHMQQPGTLLADPCLTLGELKALIARSHLLLGNDTGPRHFARAFDIPRVTVFGPTEARWTDTSHDKEVIVRVDVPCGPCHQKTCPLAQQVCMDNVTVAMVQQACTDMLSITSH